MAVSPRSFHSISWVGREVRRSNRGTRRFPTFRGGTRIRKYRRPSWANNSNKAQQQMLKSSLLSSLRSDVYIILALLGVAGKATHPCIQREIFDARKGFLPVFPEGLPKRTFFRVAPLLSLYCHAEFPPESFSLLPWLRISTYDIWRSFLWSIQMALLGDTIYDRATKGSKSGTNFETLF